MVHHDSSGVSVTRNDHDESRYDERRTVVEERLDHPPQKRVISNPAEGALVPRHAEYIANDTLSFSHRFPN